MNDKTCFDKTLTVFLIENKINDAVNSYLIAYFILFGH